MRRRAKDFTVKKMRLLKIAIAAIFIAFTAACFFLSGENFSVKIDAPKKNSGASFLSHAVTLKKADAENVKGDFERENIFFYNGVKAEMTKSNDEFFAAFETENRKEFYKIESVVGEKSVEQYVARKDGELILLPIGYDLIKKHWLNSNKISFEETNADFYKNQKNWKADCAACHLEKLDETQASFDITNLDSNSVLLACGSCHAKGLHESFPKSDEVLSNEKSFNELISAHRSAPGNSNDFYADGSTKFAAHEYQGILRSVCFVNSKSGGGDKITGEKINCLSCHSIENGAVTEVKSDEKILSQQACINCHQQFSAPESIAEHTKHKFDSAASNCYSCHMPTVAYGHLRFQRTHEISIPDPSLTARKQVPNACNLCHTDESVNWAIMSGKELWSERFRDTEISVDKQFDQPESVRSRLSNNSFVRVLTADAVRKSPLRQRKNL